MAFGREGGVATLSVVPAAPPATPAGRGPEAGDGQGSLSLSFCAVYLSSPQSGLTQPKAKQVVLPAARCPLPAFSLPLHGCDPEQRELAASSLHLFLTPGLYLVHSSSSSSPAPPLRCFLPSVSALAVAVAMAAEKPEEKVAPAAAEPAPVTVALEPLKPELQVPPQEVVVEDKAEVVATPVPVPAAEAEAEAAPIVSAAASEAAATVEKESTPAVLEKEIVGMFKEETYVVADLKEFEKKALEEFKLRIEAAVKANEFAVPSPKEEKEVAVPVAAPVAVPAAPEPTAVKEVEEVKEKAAEVVEEKEKEKKEVAEVVVEVKEKVAEVVVEVKEKVADVVVEAKEKAAEVVEVKSAVVEEAKENAGVVEEVKEKAVEVPVAEEKAVEEKVDEDISLWGVPLLHTKGDERTNVILLKFLRARDFKVNESFLMLKKTIIWRKTFKADSLVDEDFGNAYDAAAFMSGVDKDKHPVCYNVWGAFKDKKLYQQAFGSKEKLDNFLRWRFQVLEKGIVKSLNFTPEGPHAMVQITDFKNSIQFTPLGFRNAVRKAVDLLQDNYPEFVVRKIFINVPWYMGAPYTLFVSPLLSQRTKSKMVVATQGKATDTLFQFISPDQVPVQYGGLHYSKATVFDGVEAPVTEVSLKPGAIHTIEIPCTSANLADCKQKATVYWNVSVVNWDVTYGANFVPEDPQSYTSIVEKTQKVATAEEPILTSFPSHTAGKVVITIDNSASKKKKTIVYRILVKTSEGETEVAA